MTDTVIACEYQRVSFDASGRERSPEEQHGDNQRAADRHRWTLGKPYRDIGSASRYAKKAREDYARLISDLVTGTFAASVLILWESSRGSRRLSEWVRLIELCEERGVKIYVTSDGRLYDPGDARDRRSLQEDAVDGEYESAKTSKRISRASAANAAGGRPGPGRPAYGFRRHFDPDTGRVEQTIDPEEADVVRELYRRLHAGHSLTSVADDFTGRGIRRRSGKPFDRGILRAIALSHANIGERVHDPAPGRQHGRPSASASITAATWPAIVDRALWVAVRRRLTDPARVTTRAARGVHWLTEISRCNECGSAIQARSYAHPPPDRIYICHRRSCVRVPYDALNDYAEAVVLAYLGRDDHAGKLTAEPVDPGAVAALDVEIAGIDQELIDLADALGRHEITPTLAARAEPAILARLKKARARKEELTAPSLLRGLIRPGKGVRSRWKDTPMPARREIARILFVPELLGELRVVKGPLRDPIGDRVLWKRL